MTWSRVSRKVSRGSGGGQAVDEVHVDGAEAEVSGFFQAVGDHFVGLDAVDGFLDFRVEVLDAEADAVEADFTEYGQGVGAAFPGVDFDRVVAAVVFGQVEVLAEDAHEFAHFVVADEGWRAAAPVQLQ